LRLLALDASSPVLSVALVDGERVLSESIHDAKAGDLLPSVLGPLDGVEGIAVGLGPGSFTGLRVALAAAKALAYARRWPIAGASSLLALAEGFAQSQALAAQAAALAAHPPALAAQPGLVCATLEARRGEVYASLHRGAGTVWPEAVYRAEALAEKLRALSEPVVLVGPGALANRTALAGLTLSEALRAPPASAIARLCVPALRGARYDLDALFALAPNYLQPSMAEVALAEGRVGGLTAGLTRA
jgi:tRNA threonylcarbamoyladenosine biosynthesis protein TsaB